MYKVHRGRIGLYINVQTVHSRSLVRLFRVAYTVGQPQWLSYGEEVVSSQNHLFLLQFGAKWGEME